MSFVQRAIAAALVLGLGSAVLVGCGGHTAATGFCATVKRGHSEFNTVDAAHASDALAEFNRVAASAPAKLAPDLKTVHTVLRLLYTNPKAVVGDLPLFRRYVAAIGRIDTYLKRSCGVHIPKPVKI